MCVNNTPIIQVPMLTLFHIYIYIYMRIFHINMNRFHTCMEISHIYMKFEWIAITKQRAYVYSH